MCVLPLGCGPGWPCGVCALEGMVLPVLVGLCVGARLWAGGLQCAGVPWDS